MNIENKQQGKPEVISKTREKLISLEKEGKYVFHGGPTLLEKLEPRQQTSYCKETGKNENDGEPSVYVTPFADIAIFRAIVNPKNSPSKKYHSRFGVTIDENGTVIDINLKTTPEAVDEVRDKHGYVYVLDKSQFEKFSDHEMRARKEIKPIEIIKVFFKDLPSFQQLPVEFFRKK
ncbi:MAG: hypothetical protein WCO84_00280 [bacterium]